VNDAAARILALFAAGQGARAVWLDGGSGTHARGVFGDEPDLHVETDGLEGLAEVEREWGRDRSRAWLGVLSYEAGVDRLLQRASPSRRAPGVSLSRFGAALRLRGDACVGGIGDAQAVAALRERVAGCSPYAPGPWPLSPLSARLSAADYRDRVARARRHIAAGDTYQVNLSQPFDAAWTDEARTRSLPARAADVYGALRQRRPADMGALVGHGSAYVASNSPETLVDVRFGAAEGGGDLVRAWPIKGTRPRGVDPSADARARAELVASEKDRAEHVMIVDLLRNDLGRICVAGSVRAPRVPDVLTLPTVHHLVSEVRGTLRAGVGLRAIVEATFPGGSITGAPKRRTCEIIASLEDHARGVYCGAVVLLEPEGLRMSIPIRTAELDETGLVLCAGGGIVIDSDPEAERMETVVKTLAFAPPEREAERVA
jgi:para-aminobenzoate synthetase component 1